MTAVICDQGVVDGDDVVAISWLRPEHEWDSGYCLFAGGPEEDVEGSLLCLDCLLDEHPDIRDGLDLAREHGEAIRDGDDWLAA
jgi:hypothetical protein